MDTFIEQIVARKNSGILVLAKIGIVLAALLIGTVLFFVTTMFGFGSIGLMLVAGAFYGAYILISNFNVEYEYIFTNGELDVDKIIARRRRKRLITVKIQNFEQFGLARNAPGAAAGVTTFMAGEDNPTNDYFADFNHSKYGAVRLVFSPDERTLNAFRPYLPRLLRNVVPEAAKAIPAATENNPTENETGTMKDDNYDDQHTGQ